MRRHLACFLLPAPLLAVGRNSDCVSILDGVSCNLERLIRLGCNPWSNLVDEWTFIRYIEWSPLGDTLAVCSQHGGDDEDTLLWFIDVSPSWPIRHVVHVRDDLAADVSGGSGSMAWSPCGTSTQSNSNPMAIQSNNL